MLQNRLNLSWNWHLDARRKICCEKNCPLRIWIVLILVLCIPSLQRTVRECLKNLWFQTFALFRKLYVFFWVIPWRLNFICRRFGTPCLFHLHRRVGVPMKVEQIECSETSVYKIQTPGNYPEENIQLKKFSTKLAETLKCTKIYTKIYENKNMCQKTLMPFNPKSIIRVFHRFEELMRH